MKHIRKQRNIKEARLQMSGVATGDTVIVHIRRREIPCVVRMCNETLCVPCVLLHEDCLQFRGKWDDGIKNMKSFIPIEDVVE